MVFSSYVFLFLYLAFVLGAYYGLGRLLGGVRLNRARLALLLVASLWFYGWQRFDYIALILFSTLVDFYAASRIAAGGAPRRRRAFLLLSLVVNLGLLGFFKYFNFGVETLNDAMALFDGKPVASPFPDLVLPVGISFYTFQSMSYTIDVYRGVVRPSKGFLPFAAYVSLFPQLVAGPIVRYRDLAAELEKRRHTLEAFAGGVFLFMLGFAKKTLIANNAGILAASWGETVHPGLLDAWSGAVAYTVQIYFDFSGYSDMAIGLGAMLGFHFPVNFDAPYKAASITDFWRRWHISLSTWLRDYLYIPLGGNRGGPFRTARNLMLTMLLGGLWHGAAWNFVLWGGWHGLWLGIERAIGKRSPFSSRIPGQQWAGTLVIVIFGWILFAAPDLGVAGDHVLGCLGWYGVGTFTLRAPHPATLPVLMTGIGGLLALAFPTSTAFSRRVPGWKAALGCLFFALGVAQMLQQGFNPFLYFRF